MDSQFRMTIGPVKISPKGPVCGQHKNRFIKMHLETALYGLKLSDKGHMTDESHILMAYIMINHVMNHIWSIEKEKRAERK